MLLEFVLDIVGFALKAVLLLGIFGIIFSLLFSFFRRQPQELGEVSVTCLTDHLDALKDTVEQAVLSPKDYKELKKEREKETKKEPDKNLYLIDFDGEHAEAPIAELRQLVNVLLEVAEEGDEVVVRVESSGGAVHDYGLAAAQLVRIREAGIPLTVCVDSVAASGGYMMAAVADKIFAAPFAILGSIGVIVGFPNFYRLLKRYDIDYLELTAGEFKSPLSQMGEVTDKGRAKSLEELAAIHQLFKVFVQKYRPQLDIDKLATGEAWYGFQALELQLADELMTSDELLCRESKHAQVFKLEYLAPKSVKERLSGVLGASADQVFTRIWARIEKGRFPR